MSSSKTDVKVTESTMRVEEKTFEFFSIPMWLAFLIGGAIVVAHHLL